MPSAAAHRAWRINLRIPSVGRQFIVREGTPDFAVGTEIKINVRPYDPAVLAQIGSADYDSSTRQLQVTEYLCGTAGFVEFPILVQETWPGLKEPQTTLILHPDRDPEAEKARYNGNVQVIQLSREFPWRSIVESESLVDAQEVLTQHKFEFSDLLPLDGYEGWISYAAPKQLEDWDYIGDHKSFQFVNFDDQSPVGQRIYLNSNSPTILVYRDGIRLWRMGLNFKSYGKLLPTPSLIVNLPSIETFRPNISRSSIQSSGNRWQESILNAVSSEIRKSFIQPALELPPRARLKCLAWLCNIFCIESDTFATWIPPDKQPTLVARHEGKIDLLPSFPLLNEQVPIATGVGVGALLDASNWRSLMTENGNHSNMWQGPTTLLPHSLSNEIEGLCRTISDLSRYWLSSQTVPIMLQFKTAPPNHAYIINLLSSNVVEPRLPLDQGSLVLQESIQDEQDAILSAISTLSHVDEMKAWILVSALLPNGGALFQWGRAILPFDAPFQTKFAYENWGINANHPFTREILRCLSIILLASRKGSLSRSLKFQFNSILEPITQQWMLFQQGKKFATAGKALMKFIQENVLIENFVPTPEPEQADYIPGQVFHYRIGLTSESEEMAQQPFGLPIVL